MSLSPEMRSLLMDGACTTVVATRSAIMKCGGYASVMVAWKRHRQELLDACPLGFRCWGFWMFERRLKVIGLAA